MTYTNSSYCMMVKTGSCIRFAQLVGGSLDKEKKGGKWEPSQRSIIPDGLCTRQMKCELQYSK